MAGAVEDLGFFAHRRPQIQPAAVQKAYLPLRFNPAVQGRKRAADCLPRAIVRRATAALFLQSGT